MQPGTVFCHSVRDNPPHKFSTEITDDFLADFFVRQEFKLSAKLLAMRGTVFTEAEYVEAALEWVNEIKTVGELTVVDTQSESMADKNFTFIGSPDTCVVFGSDELSTRIPSSMVYIFEAKKRMGTDSSRDVLQIQGYMTSAMTATPLRSFMIGALIDLFWVLFLKVVRVGPSLYKHYMSGRWPLETLGHMVNSPCSQLGFEQRYNTLFNINAVVQSTRNRDDFIEMDVLVDGVKCFAKLYHSEAGAIHEEFVARELDRAGIYHAALRLIDNITLTEKSPMRGVETIADWNFLWQGLTLFHKANLVHSNVCPETLSIRIDGRQCATNFESATFIGACCRPWSSNTSSLKVFKLPESIASPLDDAASLMKCRYLCSPFRLDDLAGQRKDRIGYMAYWEHVFREDGANPLVQVLADIEVLNLRRHVEVIDNALNARIEEALQFNM